MGFVERVEWGSVCWQKFRGEWSMEAEPVG